jgi:hypothetical protein
MAAALSAAALLTAATSVPASASGLQNFACYGYGTGATSTAAESAAIANLDYTYKNDTRYPGSLSVVYDTEGSSGTWSAEVVEKCESPNSN